MVQPKLCIAQSTYFITVILLCPRFLFRRCTLVLLYLMFPRLAKKAQKQLLITFVTRISLLSLQLILLMF